MIGRRPKPSQLDRIEHSVRIIRGQLDRINDQQEQIMSDQSHLDTDATEIETAIAAVLAEIATLKAGNPALDFTNVDKAVADLQAVVPPPVTPPAP